MSGTAPAGNAAGPSSSSGKGAETPDPAIPRTSSSDLKLRYLSASEAASIDSQLFSPQHAFSIEQLMELAGLACAQTVYRCYPPDQFPTVLVAAGPGNQGGDGLVAARHLHHFGYEVSVWYPKQGKSDLFAVSEGASMQYSSGPLY